MWTFSVKLNPGSQIGFCQAQSRLWYCIFAKVSIFDIVFIWIDLAKLSPGAAQVSKFEGWGFSLFHLFYLWGFKVSTPCKCGILRFPTFIGSTVIILKVWGLTGYSFWDCGKCAHYYWWSDFLFYQRIWMLCPFGIQPIKSRDRLLALHLLLALH